MGREGIVFDPQVVVTLVCPECFSHPEAVLPVFTLTGDRDTAHLVLTGIMLNCEGEGTHIWTIDPADVDSGFVVS